MTATITLIVLATGVLILLSLMTLPTMGPGAAITLGALGLLLVGRELHWFRD